VGWAVNSVSAPARTIALTSGSGSGGGGSVLGCRRLFGKKVAYWSAMPHAANSAVAQASTLIAIFITHGSSRGRQVGRKPCYRMRLFLRAVSRAANGGNPCEREGSATGNRTATALADRRR